jgi:hypothetical protein
MKENSDVYLIGVGCVIVDHVQVQESLGTIMVFTLDAAVHEWLDAQCEANKQREQRRLEVEIEKKREIDRSLV